MIRLNPILERLKTDVGFLNAEIVGDVRALTSGIVPLTQDTGLYVVPAGDSRDKAVGAMQHQTLAASFAVVVLIRTGDSVADRAPDQLYEIEGRVNRLLCGWQHPDAIPGQLVGFEAGRLLMIAPDKFWWWLGYSCKTWVNNASINHG